MLMTTYAARLRFRVLTSLTIPDTEFRIVVGGRAVTMKSGEGKPIQDSQWLILLARGFGSEADAREFGTRLRAAVELSSAATRLGVDVGVGRSTQWLSKDMRDHFRRERGVEVRPNIHGLDVFADEPNVRFLDGSAELRLSTSPEEFITTVDRFHSLDGVVSDALRDSVILLNRALMQSSPVAQIVFLVSAVEMLGQDQTWTSVQKILISELAERALAADIGSDAERKEVAAAIKRLYPRSLRQGVFRVLERLGLSNLRNAWDKLYERRSALMHASKVEPGADYSDIAGAAADLCGRIILTAAAVEIPALADRVDVFYSISENREGG